MEIDLLGSNDERSDPGKSLVLPCCERGGAVDALGSLEPASNIR
jgi:hypothetical protein